MYVCENETTLSDTFLSESAPSFPQECWDLVRKRNGQKQTRVAVVGGGFAGLMAARWLGLSGFDVTIFEARNQVGGRVLSNSTFSRGRITEEGAELIGSFHTTWLKLAREYGLAMISRMGSELYEQAQLSVRLRLGRDISMKEFVQLEKAMRKRVLEPLARDASQIVDPSRPWLQPTLRPEDLRSVADALKNRYNVSPNELLWKMLEFKLVNDEVAPLERMNFLGLLCKVRAGQGTRFLFEDDQDKTRPLMRYWDELEIFRCADGCQALAREIAGELQSKDFQKKYAAKTKLHLSVAVTSIDLSQSKAQGVILGFKRVADQRQGKLADGPPIFSRYGYVILAVPPSVWKGIPVIPSAWDPKKEIGVLGMDDAVKFFSDVKKRFWINRGFAPYGGSSEIGQVWEGTDNQTQIVLGKIPNPKGGVLEVKQGIVLSAFAGPIKPGGHVPEPRDFIKELTRLYPEYRENLRKTHFSNWPLEPFIKTGYASPRLGEIFTIVKQLNDPFHNLLFFAGEHTRMDFFGYMEGALRSGERAAQQLMQHSCGFSKKSTPALERRVAAAGVGLGTL